MGGWNSGRRGGRPTVESGLTLDLYRLIRTPAGRVVANRSLRGEMRWSNGSGEVVGRIGYAIEMAEVGGNMRLVYSVTVNGTRHAQDYHVGLVTTPQPFGGRRWWFECPLTCDLVAKLYLPPGATMFASRAAYRLAYSSQRETVQDRAINQAWKLRRAMGGKPGEHPLGSYIPKRKGQHWRTYDRDVTALREREHITNIHLLQCVAKWGDPTALRALSDLARMALRPSGG